MPRFKCPGPLTRVLACSLLLLAGTSCGNRVAITGRVLDNGKPVPSAELRWVSETDPSVFVGGATDASGNIIVDAGGKRDIPVGKYKVTVVWWQMADGQPLPEGEQGTVAKSQGGAARQYSAVLDVEITSETSTLDLDVTGKGKVVEQ